nr:hypothetical protein [Tanacetum cinerariifolium]
MSFGHTVFCACDSHESSKDVALYLLEASVAQSIERLLPKRKVVGLNLSDNKGGGAVGYIAIGVILEAETSSLSLPIPFVKSSFLRNIHMLFESSIQKPTGNRSCTPFILQRVMNLFLYIPSWPRLSFNYTNSF